MEIWVTINTIHNFGCAHACLIMLNQIILPKLQQTHTKIPISRKRQRKPKRNHEAYRLGLPLSYNNIKKDLARL